MGQPDDAGGSTRGSIGSVNGDRDRHYLAGALLDDLVAESDALVADVDAWPSDQPVHLALRLATERALRRTIDPLREPRTILEHEPSVGLLVTGRVSLADARRRRIERCLRGTPGLKDTRSSTRVAGSMVVSHSSVAFISPRPLYRWIESPTARRRPAASPCEIRPSRSRSEYAKFGSPLDHLTCAQAGDRTPRRPGVSEKRIGY